MRLRTVSAIIAILICFPIVIYGNWPFYLLVYVVATLGINEFVKIRGKNVHMVPLAVAVLLVWLYLIPVSEEVFDELFNITKTEVTLLAMLILVTYTVFSKNRFMFEDAGFFLLAAVYLGLGFHYLMMARIDDLHFIFYGILIIIATDSGAYLIGRKFGKRKLWPLISPNKTIEGAIGGVLLACVIGVLYQLIFSFHSSMLAVILVTMFASMAGQLGDLVESAYKRYYNVKDSGNILPGHGGVLDRFDSWLFVFPFLYIVHFIS